MICYLCGEYIRQDVDRGAEICPICTMHYCHKCAVNLEACYICGTPSQVELKNMMRFRPVDIFSDVTNVDKRRQPRKKIKIECVYTFPKKNGTDSESKGHRALTKDISRSGLCIYSMTKLEEGHKLNFAACPVLGSRPAAIVRWVKKVNSKIYMAGLKFSENQVSI